MEPITYIVGFIYATVVIMVKSQKFDLEIATMIEHIVKRINRKYQCNFSQVEIDELGNKIKELEQKQEQLQELICGEIKLSGN